MKKKALKHIESFERDCPHCVELIKAPIHTSRSGGVLTLANIDKLIYGNERKPDVFIVSKKQQRILKMKYPKMFKPVTRYICSFEKMLDRFKELSEF